MKKTITNIILAALAVIPAVSFAVTDTNKEYKNISTVIRSHNPDAPPIKDIKKTPVSGILEVITSTNEVFYVSSDGKFILAGELLELTPKGATNHTQKTIDELTKFNFSELKLNDAIMQKKGNGKSVIVTFEDPNCGYCRKLQPELDKLTNATIYTFIVPILGQDSVDVAKDIWCSKDRVKSWNDYLVSKKRPQIANNCETSVFARNVEFAKKHNITGTPAIFLSNGKSFKGYVEAKYIQEAIK